MCAISLLFILTLSIRYTWSFSMYGKNGVPKQTTQFLLKRAQRIPALSLSKEDLQSEAARLLERAKKLRESIPPSPHESKAEGRPTELSSSTQNLSSARNETQGVGYRLYVDIGREEGTWMDPRWGASGKRIEFTVDVWFTDDMADTDVTQNMVKDNLGGTSSPVKKISSKANARLRKGFDSMGCYGGGYRVDATKSSSVIRFYLQVDGTSDSSYGDIFIPKGRLYFSLPCFGNSLRNMSRKEGPVTRREMGWHTGWRREESRIVGTFRAIPIDEATARDKF